MADTSTTPPPTRREDVTDTVHGVELTDPYRWLEAGEAPQVAQWVTQQNQHTRQALDARPDRERWHERLSALVALPTVMMCKVRGDDLFVLERARGADQFALVLRSASDRDVAPRLLLDPATHAADGAVAIDWFEPSDDGAMVAIGLSEGGTENSVLHIVHTASGQLADLRITDTRAASVAWLPDASGFWYARYPVDDQYNRHIRFHRLGTDPAVDPVVFDRRPNPEAWPDVQLSPDGKHLLVEQQVGWSRTDAHLMTVATGEWTTVVEGVDALTSFVFAGDGLLGLTSLDAPNGRIVSAPLSSPGVQHWQTVVEQRDDVVLGRPTVVSDHMLVVTSRAAVDTIERRQLDGTLVATVDDLGVVAVQQIAADRSTGRAFIVVSSFDSPTSIWRDDSASVGPWCPDAPAATDLAPLTVVHTSYPSTDGTEIGLFVIHRADVTPSADTPLILNGYGGFAISESPAWVPNLAAWCAAGGVWAIAGLRGGYEHGEGWHQAGRRQNKQNVFDDFHAAGDFLVSKGMASSDRLGLVGGSNGGLLVGAALTQRPDLARAVWCAVPLLDMIRFPQFLIARLWTDEYGDPDVLEEFGWLHAYSPYHHVHDGARYPAVLFTTAEGDTRVDPLHARKMAALLQHAATHQDERPVLLWQAGRSGHGVGKPASKRVSEGVDVLSFLSWQLGLETS
ncbi:MAG: Prolyl oligopeptidase [Ilumatobacteraceae bacterium]|nr:Prolyl oligopeptidase [Ilumatobacteraceae bacterium]